MPLINTALIVVALCLFVVRTSERMARQERCKSYLAYSRTWAEEQQTHKHQPRAQETPYGGAYRCCDHFLGQQAPALLISPFPPASKAQFTDLDREALVEAWGLTPIPNARLMFYFNGLPAIVLKK